MFSTLAYNHSRERNMARQYFKQSLLAACSATMLVIASGAATARDAKDNIPEQPLAQALTALANDRDLNIIFSSAKMKGKISNQVSGSYQTPELLSRLLAGTGLGFEIDEAGNVYVADFSKQFTTGGFQKISLNNRAYYESNLPTETENSAVEDIVIDDIVVTASRREQALQDVPASISTINPSEFKNAGLLTIDDVIAYTPGFTLSTAGQRGNGSISARGVGQQSSTAVVAVYVDDTPMTSNSAFAFGGDLFFDGLLGDLERVELLKGPQGTLWGATAIGGAVRYITKKPALEETRGNVSANLSSTKHGGFNQLYNGQLSTPIIEDKLGISLSGFFEDSDGFVDLVDEATGSLLEKNTDAAEIYGISGDLLFQPSDVFSIRIKAMHQEQDFQGISLVNLAGAELKPMYAPLTNFLKLADQKLEQTYISGTIEYDLDWATFVATSSYVKYAKDEIGDETDFADIADSIEGNPPGTTTAIPSVTNVTSKKFTQEVRLTSDNSDTFEWMVGLYYADEETGNFQSLITQPTGFNLVTIDFPSAYREYAAFANATYYLTPEFDLGFGMRFSDNETSLNIDATGVFTEPFPEAESVSDTVSTFLFTARYRPTDDLSLYARVASGYRPASANIPILDPVTGQNLAPTKVRQDSLWSYEIGAKGNTADGRFAYDIAAWLIDWNDFQTTLNFNGFGVVGNANGGVQAKGFEGTFSFMPSDDFSLTSTIAHTDSTLNEDEPLLNGLAGAAMPGVPSWTATLDAQYDFDISLDWEGFVKAGFRYTGAVDSAFVDGDPNDDIINLKVDGYVVSDLSAGVSNGSLSFNMYVTNLFDNDAYSLAGGNLIPGTTIVTAQGYPIKPRTIGAVLSYRF